jgi:competence protein ComEA
MSRPRMLLGGAVLALLLGGVGLRQWWRSAAAPPPVVVTRFPPPESRSVPVTGPTTPAQHALDTRPAPALGAVPAAAAAPHPPSELGDPLMVHVVGSVRKPGVYRLAPKARLIDAVHAAGGAKAGADLEAVNLASFVQDGEQIRVPALSERRSLRVAGGASSSAPRSRGPDVPSRPVRSTARYPLAEASPAPAPAGGAASGEAGSKGSGLVNINTGAEEELKTLPGVGPKTAAAILAYRQEHGPFQRAEDLLEIRGIGAKKLARMRDRVVVR